MKLFVVLFCSFYCITAAAQTDVKLEEIRQHIGDSVRIKGYIKSIVSIENSDPNVTCLAIGASYPNQLLSIIIKPDCKMKMGLLLSKKSIGGLAIVTGRLQMEKDKVQIMINDPGQIKIIIDEVIPDSRHD